MERFSREKIDYFKKYSIKSKKYPDSNRISKKIYQKRTGIFLKLSNKIKKVPGF